MQHVKLSNDKYIIQTSKGMYTLTPCSFNFNKIKKLINYNASEEEILPLLKTPELPDGVYKAYLIPSQGVMHIMHIKETPLDVIKLYTTMDGTEINEPNDAKFVGIYASKQELIADWPEYTI